MLKQRNISLVQVWFTLLFTEIQLVIRMQKNAQHVTFAISLLMKSSEAQLSNYHIATPVDQMWNACVLRRECSQAGT